MTPLYSEDQRYNIHMKLHPDCGTKPTCRACHAREEVGGGSCKGDLTGLALNLFQEAAMQDANANLISLGYAPRNREAMRRTAKDCDRAARLLYAKTIKLVVVLDHPTAGHMICTRSYPRFDHLDPYGYREDERELAEAKCKELHEKFGHDYFIREELT